MVKSWGRAHKKLQFKNEIYTILTIKKTTSKPRERHLSLKRRPHVRYPNGLNQNFSNSFSAINSV